MTFHSHLETKPVIVPPYLALLKTKFMATEETTSTPLQEDSFLDHLQGLQAVDDSYWSFKGRSQRSHCHALIQYPAMMVPEMQGELIDLILHSDLNVKSIFDPFVGSGTTLGEALIRGLDFGGRDVNPLAILACEVKSAPLYVKALKKKSHELLNRICTDNSNKIDVDFFGRDKWFTPTVQVELSKIRRSVMLEKSAWARRFFWLVVSDTVRATCNSRSSTYKLHIKTLEQIQRIGSPVSVFRKTLDRNIAKYEEQRDLMHERGLLRSGAHQSKVDLKIEDVRDLCSETMPHKYDLLVTSPPYGDNITTVTYGQYSYLPLQWIDTGDIRSSVSWTLLQSTSAIDSAGLGGSRRDALRKANSLSEVSCSFDTVYKKILAKSDDGAKRLSAFFADMNGSLPNIIDRLNSGSYMFWTLGNRHISGIKIPMDRILRELLEHLNCRHVYSIKRDIPSKKMASRNKNVETMTEETILIMRAN